MDDYAVKLTLPVLWGNQDLFGHVNNVVHLRWFECARVDYWERGMRSVMVSNDLGPILVNVTCNYRKQIRFPDNVTVGGRITRVGNASLTMEHTIFSEEHNAIAAEGHSIVAMFNYKTQQTEQINDEILAVISKIEGREVRWLVAEFHALASVATF